MPKRLMAASLGAGLLGVGAAFVYAPLGVILSFIGVFFAFQAIGALNTWLVRAAAAVTAVLHGVTVAEASGSWLVGASVLPFMIVGPPGELAFRRLGFRMAVLGLGTVPISAAMILASGPPSLGWLAALPMFSFATFFGVMFARGLSAFHRASPGAWGVRIGDPVPDFVLPARGGKPDFQLSNERGHLVLLQFLRGDWCPACHVIMRILSKEAPRLAERNIKVVLISPSSGPDAEEHARALGIECLVLIDPEHKAARQLGAFDALGVTKGDGDVSSLPLPATFLIDAEGRLSHSSRPDDAASFLDPRDLLRALEARAPATAT